MNKEVNEKNVSDIFDLLRKSAELFKDKTFIRYQEKNNIIDKSFLETFKDSEKIALYTTDLSNRLGHRVHAALLGNTSYEYVASMFGILGGNGIVVPIDTQTPKDKMVKNLIKADVDVVFFDWKFYSYVTYIQNHCDNKKMKFICFQDVNYFDNFFSILDFDYGNQFLPKINPNEIALIIFTSGTTGKSKGVMLSHANEIDNVFSIHGDKYPIAPDPSEEILLNVLPMHHIYSINCDFFVSLKYGLTICLCPNLKKIIQSIQVFNPTFIHMVPIMAKMFANQVAVLQRDNPNLQIDEIKKMVFGKRLTRITTGGGALSPDLAKRFYDIGLPIGQGYGMSECSPMICQPYFDYPEKVKSVGKPIKGYSIRIQDAEIQVKSPSVMIGYYKDPELTKEAFTEDGFLKTGDLGYMDDDGFVYINGRKKNLIILENGENVSPELIESAFENDPLILDIMVFENNNRIEAEVYPNFEFASAANIDDVFSAIWDIIQNHNTEFPSYCQIVKLNVRKHPFEKTSSNKIIRHKHINLQSNSKKAINGLLESSTELQKEIFKSISHVTGHDNIGLDDDLIDYGLDSLTSIMLIEEIETKLGKSITFSELSTHRTIRKIENLLIDKEKNPEKNYPIKKVYPLTTMQNFFGYILKGNTTGNLPFFFELDKNIDMEKLKKAIEKVIDAHPELKGIIKPGEDKKLKFFRDDSRVIEIKIEKFSDEEWKRNFDKFVVPFEFDGSENLFHIRLFETETSKYMLFDVAHIIGDGLTMDILLEDVSKSYMGFPIEKEKFTFYDYILDYYEKEAAGEKKKNLQYYDDLLKGLTIERSILNKKKAAMDLTCEDTETVYGPLKSLNKKKIMYFCKQNNISENALLYTAFNYCVGIFSNLKDNLTCSIHGGRTDARFKRTVGSFFLSYLCRYNIIPHETVRELLKRTARQIMDTMKCYTSTPRQGEMFFQYQGDILNVNQVGGLPAKLLHVDLDALPFHMQVMSGKDTYYLNLRYYKKRFDNKLIENFLTCYESIVNAMLVERSASMLKHYIPDELFPHSYTVTAKELNDEAGYKLLKNVPLDNEVCVYILDDRHEKKPIGAWGRLCIKDYEPDKVINTVKYPYRKGVILYDTGIIARILPDGKIDFLENSGRFVWTNYKYRDLRKLERFVEKMDDVSDCRAYMTFNKENCKMKLELEIYTNKEDRLLNKICADTESSLDQSIVPQVVKIIEEKVIRN